jgi:hypothetical protein
LRAGADNRQNTHGTPFNAATRCRPSPSACSEVATTIGQAKFVMLWVNNSLTEH